MMQKPMIIKALKVSSVNVNMFTNVSAKIMLMRTLQLKFITSYIFFLRLLSCDFGEIFIFYSCENKHVNKESYFKALKWL